MKKGVHHKLREGRPDETAIFPQPGRRPKAMCWRRPPGRNNPGPARKNDAGRHPAFFPCCTPWAPDTSSSIRDTLVQDRIPDQEKAQEEIYRRLRPSSPPTPEIAASFFRQPLPQSGLLRSRQLAATKLNQRLDLKENEGKPAF